MNCTKNPRYSPCMVQVQFKYSPCTVHVQFMYSSCTVQIKYWYSSICLLCTLCWQSRPVILGITNNVQPFASFYLLSIATFFIPTPHFFLGSGVYCRTSIDPDVGGQEKNNNSSSGGELQPKTDLVRDLVTNILIPPRRSPQKLFGTRVLADTAKILTLENPNNLIPIWIILKTIVVAILQSKTILFLFLLI